MAGMLQSSEIIQLVDHAGQADTNQNKQKDQNWWVNPNDLKSTFLQYKENWSLAGYEIAQG